MINYDLVELLTPVKTDFTLKRLGHNYDGGYVVPLELCFMCDKVLSFGVNDDISFELDYIKLKNANYIKIDCFDASVDSLPEYDQNYQDNLEFHKNFLGPATYNEYININDLDFDWHTCVKMDIEGSEYDCLNVLHDNKFSQIPVLIIEVHLLPERHETVNDLIMLLNRIETYMVPIHVHQNYVCGTFMYNNCIFSNAIEITFINKL